MKLPSPSGVKTATGTYERIATLGKPLTNHTIKKYALAGRYGAREKYMAELSMNRSRAREIQRINDKRAIDSLIGALDL